MSRSIRFAARKTLSPLLIFNSIPQGKTQTHVTFVPNREMVQIVLQNAGTDEICSLRHSGRIRRRNSRQQRGAHRGRRHGRHNYLCVQAHDRQVLQSGPRGERFEENVVHYYFRPGVRPEEPAEPLDEKIGAVRGYRRQNF